MLPQVVHAAEVEPQGRVDQQELEICWAIRAPASIPTTDRRPTVVTIPVASTVNSTNVPRRRNTGRNGSNTPAHDPGKITK